MQPSRSTALLTRLVAYFVMAYGLSIVAHAFVRQLHAHPGHHLDVLLVTVPQIEGLGFFYLGSLLLRRKYNAWLATIVLSLIIIGQGVLRAGVTPDPDTIIYLLRLITPLLVLAVLFGTRSAYTVRSDVRSFTQALRFSVLVLFIAFVYGLGGFSLLDMHDFHREISLPTAVHLTLDQFSLTTDHPVAHTRRARLFLDSLSVISVAAVAYAAVSLFDPIRVRLTNQASQREHAERLLREYLSDIDDFFKLWPHNKQYYFDKTGEAALAYHVTRGMALVVGNPFGDPKQFRGLLKGFSELCFVNDWTPAFIHVSGTQRKLFESFDYHLQKIGEEGLLDMATWPELQTGKDGKYFREIRNRFVKLHYSVEIVTPPHSDALLSRLREITHQWLQKPGRAERGFMLGYHNTPYLQQCSLVILRDEAQQIQGFLNLVPTYENGTANYDLLRVSENAPGNAADFLLISLLDHLHEKGCTVFNLGLSPLAGMDEAADAKDSTVVDNALHFFYSNGDRLYSFSGLYKFKNKYRPNWQDRYIAYPGGIRNFTRTLTALNRAMKVKNKRS